MLFRISRSSCTVSLRSLSWKVRFSMPTTRSASRAAIAAVADVQGVDVASSETSVPKTAATKRKQPATKTKSTAQAPKKARSANTDAKPVAVAKPVVTGSELAGTATPPVLVPAKLTFDFEDAKQHLIAADHRFEGVFSRMKCRPFEHLEQVDPFRTLAHSILGQQISWLAARSITHRFVRLFDQSLPEKPVDGVIMDSFPTAHQVTTMDVPTLRTAGLSQRKAEYVLDLAARFADGRLSTEKLLEADDEALYEMLTAVRGIGRWTVDMFAIFSLRRPDILPVGDLGVQRGILRWVLSRHLPSYTITISPKKLPRPPTEEPEVPESQQTDVSVTLPLPGTTPSTNEVAPKDASVIPPAPVIPVTPVAKPAVAAKRKGKGTKKAKADSSDEDTDSDDGVLPTPFTPSINKILAGDAAPGSSKTPSLPEGLTVAKLKSRLDSKNKIKGAILTPQEMHDLTEPWQPYRSLGVYYMWALAEETSGK